MLGDRVVVSSDEEVVVPLLLSPLPVEDVSFAAAVAFFFGNGSGGSKMSSSFSASSSSLGFSSGSRDPVVILTRGLLCRRNLIGAMSRFACTIVLPFRGMSTDMVGCFET